MDKSNITGLNINEVRLLALPTFARVSATLILCQSPSSEEL